MIHVTEADFRRAVEAIAPPLTARFVTGPGRSGAIAAVYASHAWGIPFLPFGQSPESRDVLLVDTFRSLSLIRSRSRYRMHSGAIGIMKPTQQRRTFWFEFDIVGEPECRDVSVNGMSLPAEHIRAILALHPDRTVSRIAEITGHNPKTVRRVLRFFGHDTPRRPYGISPARLQSFQRARQQTRQERERGTAR